MIFFRSAVRNNLSLILFLLAYLVLTVVGNVLYLTPIGPNLGQLAIPDFDIQKFKTFATLGFFVLLFMPLAIVPIVAFLTRKLARLTVVQLVSLFQEFRPVDFSIISATLYAYVACSFWQSNAIGLLRQGANSMEGVNNRFDLLGALGFWPQMTLKSLLIFLATYAFIRSLNTRAAFWISAAIVHLLLLSSLLVLLNMKWPILIFYVAITLAGFSCAQRRPYFVATLCGACLIAIYLLISVVVLRAMPAPLHVVPPPAQNANVTPPSPAPAPVTAPPTSVGAVSKSVIKNAPFLGATLINRMAQPYPYYFETFTNEGHVCGTILDRIERKISPCQPSNLVYNKMFGVGEYAGRATAPQAIHVYGYALNGWIGALIELTLASIVIGIFISVPVSASSLPATIAVMGGLTGYFFSQLPFEGPILYDHGILWWGLLIIGYSTFRWFYPAETKRTSELLQT